MGKDVVSTTTIEEGVVPVMVFKTEVVINENKEEPSREDRGIKKWKIIAAGLIAIGILIWAVSAVQYNNIQQSYLAGSYTVTRGEDHIPIGADVLISAIDQDYSLRTYITNGSDGNIFVSMFLVTESRDSYNRHDNYEIEKLILSGKETKRLEVYERIVPMTSIIGEFNASIPRLGNTLNLEITVSKTNSSSNYGSSFFYNIEILRESNGKIYLIKQKEDMKREPGFEGIAAIIAVAIIAVIIRRKKE